MRAGETSPFPPLVTCLLYYKRSPGTVSFSVNFVKFLRTSFFYRATLVTPSLWKNRKLCRKYKWMKMTILFCKKLLILLLFIWLTENVYKTEKVLTKWNYYFPSFNTHDEFISFKVSKIDFSFNTSFLTHFIPV